MGPAAPRAQGSPVIKVLAYQSHTVIEADESRYLDALSGIDADWSRDLADFNATNLANYDVLYVGSVFLTRFDSKAGIIQSFLSNGGGVVVGQAQTGGPIDWLPTGLQASVGGVFYPSPGMQATASGLSHPILNGLSANEFGGPADTIYTSSLGPDWDLLLVSSQNPNIVGLAAGTYGQGRLLLWPDRLTPWGGNPSDQALTQAYEWVAGSQVPEPGAFAIWSLIGLSFLGMSWYRRRKAA